MIPDSFIQGLLSRVDIVTVIESAVPLKRSGANYFACCPFHSEKSPSFSVSQSKQFYHCFGCGAHGSAIGFLMEHQGLSFPEAVKDLAAQVGLSVPEEIGGRAAGVEALAQDGLLTAVSMAAQFYQSDVINKKSVAYLKSRGVSEESIEMFGLGYAPARPNALAEVFSPYPSRALEDAGLISLDEESGRARDFFYDRIIFPIHDQRGRTIAFGGRAFGDAKPKYLNSRETPLFEKGQHLYGLHLARKAIQDAGIALVVEGYMDVVMLAQHGVRYSVATLGTATTADHLSKLFRLTDTVIFCFDGDAAGEKAAWRAMENALALLEDGKVVRFIFLPTGEDPDSYVRTNGKAAFENLLRTESRPLSAFLLMKLASTVDMESSEGCARLIALASPFVARVSGTALRGLLGRELARMTGLPEAEVTQAVSQSGEKDRARQANEAPRGVMRSMRTRCRAVMPLDRRLSLMLASNPSWVRDLNFDVLPLEGNAERSLLLGMIEYARKTKDGSVGGLTEFFRGRDLEPAVASLAAECMSATDALNDEFIDGLFALYDSERKRRLELLSKKADSDGLNAEEMHLFRTLTKRPERGTER